MGVGNEFCGMILRRMGVISGRNFGISLKSGKREVARCNMCFERITAIRN